MLISNKIFDLDNLGGKMRLMQMERTIHTIAGTITYMDMVHRLILQRICHSGGMVNINVRGWM